MMTSSNGNIFYVTGPCEGNSPVNGYFPSQKPVTRSFEIYWSAPEKTIEQTIETPVIWDAIPLIMTSL